MNQPTFDPGLTQQYTGVLRRTLNKDGSFNVVRRGGSWRDFHPYLALLNMTWGRFLAIVLTGYVLLTTLFGAAYFVLGPGQLQGADAPTEWGRFLNDFFFSSHTLTTVGYGNIAPKSTAANALTALEAITGIMGIALGTGLLFGRFSRPSARISFGERLLVAPYAGGSSLQVRLVNMRPNILMELEASMILMTVEGPPGAQRRRFQQLKLERQNIYFLPLTWTLVHPIDESSPVFGKSADDLQRIQAEIVTLIKGFDDTFSQIVHARYSYRYDEMVWDAAFQPAFEIDPGGNLVLDVNRVSSNVRRTEVA